MQQIKQIHFVDWKINLLFLLFLLPWIALVYAFSWGKTSLQVCQESYMKSTNAVQYYNEENPEWKVELPKYNCNAQASSGGKLPLPSEQNLRKKFWLESCRATNDFHRIGKYNLEWMAYDIACDTWKSFDVKSPWYYEVEKIWYWVNLWNFMVLKKLNESLLPTEVRLVLGHLVSTWKVWDLIPQYAIIWQTNISGSSTWMHVHIELWDWVANVSREYALGLPYNKINWTALLNHRKWDFGQQLSNVYYFTSYNLWDVKQNDSSPCIGASGKDLCALETKGVRTMALTSDIREKLGVKFWDKVRLLWDEGCEGVYEVHDEMNKRFRQIPWVLRPNTPYYIKWDIPSKSWWVCSVNKIN